MHGPNGSASIRHWKVVPSSLATKRNVAIVLHVGFSGAIVIVVTGMSLSAGRWMFQPCTAGPRSTWPFGSTARTARLCQPTARPEYCAGEVQVSNGAPSSAHWKVAPAMSETKLNDASVDVVLSAGPCVMNVSGAGTT